MKNFYLFVFLFISLPVFSQESWDDLSGKERAYLFHMCRRTDILKPELFYLFEFKDSIPYINDTLPDYGYVEKRIVQFPSKLVLHVDEMSRKSDGVLSELSVRYALWELDQVLQYRNSKAEEDKPLKAKLKKFEKYALEKVPQSAVRMLNNGDYVLIEALNGYYAPSLTVADKMAAIVNAGFPEIEQMLIINAIMHGEEKYVQERSREIFELIGGKTGEMQSFISAVGDGSNWAEITGGFNTPYTVGLPDEKGLFRFTIEELVREETERKYLSVKAIEQKQLRTSGDMETVVHIDVFGYHPERQTTVAIQKGGSSYVLYGKNEHRLVSPDSTYGDGVTYWRLMHKLEHYHIANLKEDLYGKRGYEYQIDLYEKKIENTLMQIKKTEYRLDQLRHTPEGKPKIKKKKLKKKDLGTSDQAGTGHPTSKLSKLDKKKNIEQNRLIQLNSQLDAQKAILEQLKIDLEEAHEKLIRFETKLDFMRKTIGYTIMEYEQDGHMYYFKDGATYNYLTQDFTFPPTRLEEAFIINHISFGKELFTDKIDENFVHLNISKSNPYDKFALRKIARDSERMAITESDSLQIIELFNYLLKKEIKPTINVIAGGILGESEGYFYRDSTLVADPWNEKQASNNGLIKYDAKLFSDLRLEVTVFEDRMIPSDFIKYRSAYSKVKGKYPGINEVDFYTGIRARSAAINWINQLKQFATIWIKNPSDSHTIISKLKKLKVKKVNFLGGKAKLKVPEMVK